MTAGELIELLKTVYPDTEVIINGPEHDDPDYYLFHKYYFTKEDVKVTCYGKLIINIYDD